VWIQLTKVVVELLRVLFRNTDRRIILFDNRRKMLMAAQFPADRKRSRSLEGSHPRHLHCRYHRVGVLRIHDLRTLIEDLVADKERSTSGGMGDLLDHRGDLKGAIGVAEQLLQCRVYSMRP